MIVLVFVFDDPNHLAWQRFQIMEQLENYQFVQLLPEQQKKQMVRQCDH